MNLNKYRQVNQNPSRGIVFTPRELVDEILSKIPESVYLNKEAMYLVPAFDNGEFIFGLYDKLTNEYGYTDKDVKSRIVGIESSQKYIGPLKRRGFMVYKLNFLEYKFTMKFDVIVANYPYQESNGAATNKPIWDKFVDTSFKLCKDGGYIAAIHPPGWRNVGGKFVDVQNLLSSKDIIYLNVNSVETGKKVFGATTPFDYYVCKNDTYNGTTIISTEDDVILNHDITKFNFIPSSNFELFQSLISETNNVNILYNTKYHTQHSHVSKTKTENFKFPLVRYAYRDGSIDFRYSNIDKGHFGIPKVLIGNGADSGNILIDSTGEYGMTEYVFSIVDDVDNLKNIKKALESDKFKKLMDSCRFGRTMYNRRVINSFRKDFWKEFI